MASVLPSRHSICIQFSVPSRIECRQVTPCRASSRASSASGTKAETVSNTHFELKALSFRFVPRGAAGRFQGHDSAENARSETQPSTSLQAASCNRKRINAGGLRAVRKTAGHKIQLLIAKGDRVMRLSHEFFRDRRGNRRVAHAFDHFLAKAAITHNSLSPHDARHCSSLDLVASRWIA